MNTKLEIGVLLEIVGVAVLAFVIYTAIGLHDARIKAEDSAKYSQQLVQQSQTANAELAKERDANQQALQQATSVLTAQRQQAVTPQQMTDLITRATSLKPTIVTVPATATAPEQQVAAIPVSELGSAADLVTSCEQCKLDLTASQSNVSSLQKQVEQRRYGPEGYAG